jgi:hypothetical protein
MKLGKFDDDVSALVKCALSSAPHANVPFTAPQMSLHSRPPIAWKPASSLSGGWPETRSSNVPALEAVPMHPVSSPRPMATPPIFSSPIVQDLSIVSRAVDHLRVRRKSVGDRPCSFWNAVLMCCADA